MTTASRPLPSSLRRMSLLDAFLAEGNRALQVLTGVATATRPNPADVPPPALSYSGAATATAAASAATEAETATAVSAAALDYESQGAPEAKELSRAESRHVAGLMRVNHVGEICAQALYRGQATFTRNPATRALFEKAADEEVDHLAWLNDRLREVNGRPSLLNPFWYTGAFVLGAAASRVGDSFNLGFMAETEKQVTDHLDRHLRKLPEHDDRSRRILEQMRLDESNHRKSAVNAGGAYLPKPVKGAMRAMSKVMTTTAYWV